MKSEGKVPLLTNIQRFSMDDGPGIRTIVFFKGCPLSCPWCHNPECVFPEVDFYYYEQKCVRCGLCAEICPEKAITLPGPNGEPPRRDRKKCTRCMECVNSCPQGALSSVGELWSMEKILQEALSDMLFYKNSGGGVTISGGESLLFHEYAIELAKRLQAEKCHVAVETSCFGKWEHLNELASCVDLFLTDIKCMDPSQHKSFVGVPNELILDNIRKLVNQGKQVRIRVPVIPGFNDNRENFERMAEFLLSLERPVEAVDLLPYHSFAESKYDQLDREYKYKGLPNMEQEEAAQFELILKDKGLSTTIGGTEGVTVRE